MNSIKTMEQIDQYIAQMTPIQRTAYLIAKEHLGTSFNIKKSIGFLEWLKSKRS
jgi:hypothetical protein